MSEFCLAHRPEPFGGGYTCLRAKGHDGDPHLWISDPWIADTEIGYDLAYGLGGKDIMECRDAYPRRWEELAPEAFTVSRSLPL